MNDNVALALAIQCDAKIKELTDRMIVLENILSVTTPTVKNKTNTIIS